MKIAVRVHDFSIGLDIFIGADFTVAMLIIIQEHNRLSCVGLYFFDGISEDDEK